MEFIFNEFYYSEGWLPANSVIYEIQLKIERFEREGQREKRMKMKKRTRKKRRKGEGEERGGGGDGGRRDRGKERGTERDPLPTGSSAAIAPLYFTPYGRPGADLDLMPS